MAQGKIGKKLIKLLKNFDNDILIFDKLEDKELKKEKNIKYSSMKEIFKNSDVISIHLPLTSDTKNLINFDLFKIMKDDSLIINTSRGEVINEEDLFKFLRLNPRIHALFDVFKNEPYEGPLLKLDNVTLTPHISAYARETRIEMENEAVQNLLKSI